jgi:hypothetical protein
MMKHWHSSEHEPKQDALYLGVRDANKIIELYCFDGMYGWARIADHGEVHYIPPAYWCEIPRFDGDQV